MVNWASVWTGIVNFNCIPFEPNFKILKDFSNILFFLLETTYGIFSKIKQFLGRARAKKIPKRGHFIDAESIQKTLKTLNFTITYAILMKLTKNLY